MKKMHQPVLRPDQRIGKTESISTLASKYFQSIRLLKAAK